VGCRQSWKIGGLASSIKSGRPERRQSQAMLASEHLVRNFEELAPKIAFEA